MLVLQDEKYVESWAASCPCFITRAGVRASKADGAEARFAGLFREPVWSFWCVWYNLFLLGIIAADRETAQGTRVEFWAVRTGKSVKLAKKAPKQGIWDELALQVGTLRRETVAVGRRAKTKGMAGCLGCRVLSLVKFQMEERFRTKAKAEGLITVGRFRRLNVEEYDSSCRDSSIRAQIPVEKMVTHVQAIKSRQSSSQPLYPYCMPCQTPWGIATWLFACVLVVIWEVGYG